MQKCTIRFRDMIVVCEGEGERIADIQQFCRIQRETGCIDLSKVLNRLAFNKMKSNVIGIGLKNKLCAVIINRYLKRDGLYLYD